MRDDGRRTTDDDGRTTDDNDYFTKQKYDFYLFLIVSLMTSEYLHENHRKLSEMCFGGPWQETFADAGRGDGGGNSDQSLFHTSPTIRCLFVF